MEFAPNLAPICKQLLIYLENPIYIRPVNPANMTEAISMESIDIGEIMEFRKGKAVKKVPILTSNLMGSFLFIEKETDLLSVRTKDFEEMHYIVEGGGVLDIDGEVREVSQGLFLLVPAHSQYHYSTNINKKLVVLVVKHLNVAPVRSRTKDTNLECVEDGEEDDV